MATQKVEAKIDASMRQVKVIIQDKVNKLENPRIKSSPVYLLRYTHPGGYRSLGSIQGMIRNMALEHTYPSMIGLKTLVGIHQEMTKFDSVPPGNDPSIDLTKPRADDAYLLYPSCPRGFPVEYLHRRVFEGDKEKIQKYDHVIEKYGNWFKALEDGAIDIQDRSKLFRIVSSLFYGTYADFVASWIKFHKKTVVGLDTSSGEMHPIVYALKLHELVLRSMPFVTGNRRVARYILSLVMVKNGYFPPMFWSSSCYNAVSSPLPWVCRHSAIKNREDSKSTIEALKSHRFNFACYVINKSLEGAHYMVKDHNILVQRDLEKWQYGKMDALSIPIEEFIKERGTVRIDELVKTFSLYIITEGDQVLDYCAPKGKFYWNNLSEPFCNAIKDALSTKRIGYSYSLPEQYHSFRSEPNFNSSQEESNWIPVNLKYIH